MSTRRNTFDPRLLDGMVEIAPGRYAKAPSAPAGVTAGSQAGMGVHAPPAPSKSPYRSKTEARFAAWLTDLLADMPVEIDYETCKWTLVANPAATARKMIYTPDFVVAATHDGGLCQLPLLADGQPITLASWSTIYIEAKGYWFVKDKYRFELARAYARRWHLSLYLATTDQRAGFRLQKV